MITGRVVMFPHCSMLDKNKKHWGTGKGRLKKKKKVIIITFWGEGGVSEGHLSLFFGLKMIFKQF